MKKLFPEIILSILLTIGFAAAAHYRHTTKIRPIVRPTIQYNAKKTQFIHHTTHEAGVSYLVRGNLPLNADGRLSYEELAETLSKILGISLPEFHLTVVSLIHNTPADPENNLKNEFLAFNVSFEEFERQFPDSHWPPFAHGIDTTKEFESVFDSHPVSLIWFPVSGCLSPKTCSTMNLHFDFKGLIKMLSDLLHRPKPTVIYVHCTSGSDRVGTVMAAYKMKSFGKSLADMLREIAPEQNPFMANSLSALYTPYSEILKWYAQELHQN